MNATDLYRAGRLDEAIQALGVALRDNPTDVQRRSFLFELLCFAGQYDRADRQLDILASEGKDAQTGALLYRGALHGERVRQEMFRTGTLPEGTAPAPVSGTLNGERFSSLTDADPRIGARLEVIAAGQYLWLPFQHVETLQVQPPAKLRDLYWAVGFVNASEQFRARELGEVLLPVLTALAWNHPDPQVRLGRVTEWQRDEDERELPAGQKLWLVDGEEFPILEVRELTIDLPSLETPRQTQNAPA